MATTRSTARSWLIVLGALWVIFLVAVVVVMVTRDARPLTAVGDDAGMRPVSLTGDENGWFTTEQAERGGGAYAQACAHCHGAMLEGGVGPALAGDTFWNRWEGDTVHTFFEVTRQTMPQEAPGSLPDDTYADITAYVLQVNDFPAGAGELPPDEAHLQSLPIDRAMTEEVAADAPPPGVADPAPPAEDEPTDAEEPAEAEETEAPAEAEEPTEAEEPEEPTEPTEPTDVEEPTEVEEAAEEPAEAEEPTETEEPTEAEEAEEPTEPAEPDDAEVPTEEEAEREPGDDGAWFSEAQVQAGSTAFSSHCAACHGADLQGNPPLIGGGFPERYNTVWELFQYVRQTMPQDDPGSLSDETYLQTIAYVLDANGYPTGEQTVVATRTRLEDLRLDPELASEPTAEDDPADVEADEPPADEPPADDDAANDEADEPTDDEANGDAEEANGEAATDEAWFTEEQADRGADDYAQHCAACHGDDLQGDPPLTTDALQSSFDTVWDLFDYTRTQMPQDDPGSLDDDTYADIVAHILHLNEFPAGDEELEADEQAMQDMPLDEDQAEADAPTDTDADDADTETAEEEPADVEAGEPTDDAANDEAEEANGEAATDEAWFTEEQADRGADDYAQHCAACHGDDLQGDPPLTTDALQSSFDTVWDLFDYTRTQMPQDDPGSLDDDTYADIVAHILHLNEFPAGDEELEADEQAMQDMPLDEDQAEADAPTDADADDPDADTDTDTAEEEEPVGPERGRAWLEIETDPDNVTINLVGPGGFVGRATGGQAIRDLVPGVYVVAASRGHQSVVANVTLRSGETGRLSLVLDELSRSDDVPEDPAVPMTEVPAIPMRPEERFQVGDPPQAPATQQQPTDEGDQDEADADADQPGGVTAAEPRDPGPTRDPEDQLQAVRGEQAYVLHCARCHGETLSGNVAPALAGPVFLERWGGHPVDWLYFQARAAMPPHGPGFLSEQTYADIIVYMLRESDILDGHEDFRPHDEAFRTLVIAPRATADGRPELEAQVERLRRAIQAPHDDAILGPAGPLRPIEWPDDLGAAPIGPSGRIDAAIAVAANGEGEEDDDGDAEQEEPGEGDDDANGDANGEAEANGPVDPAADGEGVTTLEDAAPIVAPEVEPGTQPAPPGAEAAPGDEVEPAPAPEGPDAPPDAEDEGGAPRPNRGFEARHASAAAPGA
jgi:mono/diheme cytochrome c family protein